MLKSSTIFLRTLQSNDVDNILKWENNPKNWQVSGTTRDFTEEEIEVFVNSEHDLEVNQQIRYVICLNSTKEAIGTLDLFEHDAQSKTVGIGILIANQENRKRGYASETLNLIIDYCRNELKLVNLFCNIIKMRRIRPNTTTRVVVLMMVTEPQRTQPCLLIVLKLDSIMYVVQ